MIARFSGAVLGLLAFGVATVAGVVVGNPVHVVLSRAIWALIVFCIIGLAVGAAAQAVVAEYHARKSAELFPPDNDAPAIEEPENKSTPPDAKPMGTA
jgi:F0F1-type ATP synthase assembly protein I